MFSLVAAYNKLEYIGKDGKLPWKKTLKKDLQRFKELTMGKICIVGRKTWETLPVLSGREIVVVSKQDKDFDRDGFDYVLQVDSCEKAMECCSKYAENFVIGGGQIYEQMISYCEKMYLTIVEDDITEGDVKFPKWSLSDWKLEKLEKVDNLIFSEFKRR